jgi:hypothetical protein
VTGSMHSFRQPRERPQDHPFPTMHPARFLLTPLMIVAAEMQNAMDQEHRQLFVKRSLTLFGLAGCSRHGNHHVTKQACGGMERLPRGKGQHVGRAILAPIPTIETSHPLIADEHDAQLRRSFPDIGKNRPCQSIQARLIKRDTSNLTLHMNRH